MVKPNTYVIVFLAMAVFFFLVRSVLRQRTGIERLPVTDTFFSRASMIAAVTGAVFYVTSKAELSRVLDQAALSRVAAPTAPTAPAVGAAPAAEAPRVAAAPTATARN